MSRKHIVNGDQQNGWYCYECSFATRDVSEAAEHDGKYDDQLLLRRVAVDETEKAG